MDLLLRVALYAPEDLHFRSAFHTRFQPQIALCVALRQCREEIGRFPDLQEFMQYLWAPCDAECDRSVPIEDWFRLAEHAIVQFGLAPSCTTLHVCYVHELLAGRMPTLEEFFDAAQEESEERVTQWMQEDVEEYWSKKSADVDLERFPARAAEEESDCCICQEPVRAGQPIRELPCGHRFHSGSDDCSGIERWLEKCSACPLCKSEV